LTKAALISASFPVRKLTAFSFFSAGSFGSEFLILLLGLLIVFNVFIAKFYWMLKTATRSRCHTLSLPTTSNEESAESRNCYCFVHSNPSVFGGLKTFTYRK